MRFWLYEKLTLLFMLTAIFLSLYSGIDNWFANQIKQKKHNAEELRRKQLARIAALTDKKLFITRKILPILPSVVEFGADISQLHIFFKKHYQIDLNFYKFSPRGKLEKTAPERPPNLWLMKNLFSAVSEKRQEKMPQLAKNLDKKIQFAFGYGKDLVSIRENPERIIQTFFENQEGLICWTSRPKGGLIIYASSLPEQYSIFRNEATKMRKPPLLYQVGILKESGHKSRYFLPLQAYRHLFERGRENGEFAGKNWAFLKSNSGQIFFASFFSKDCLLNKSLFRIRLILAIAFLITVYMIVFTSTSLSLKALLISMFFASSLIPLSGLAVTSVENLEVFQQIEARKIRAQQEETLGNIAQNFSAYLASCSATLMELTQNPGGGPEDQKTLRMVDNILRVFPDARITTRNSGGQILFYHGPIVSQGRETVFKSLSRKLIERYAPERLDEHKYNGNPFSDSLVNKDDMGFGTLLNFPDILQVVSTGNSELLLFYRVLPSSAGDCAIVIIELSTYHTIRNYLQSLNQKQFSVENTLMQVCAFFPDGYRWSLSPLKENEQELLKLGEKVWLTGTTEFSKVAKKSSGYALGIRFPSLSGNCLMAYCSDDHINRALNKMQQRLYFGSIIALILLLSVSMWLHHQLLSPLQHLERGVEALSRRKFEARLPEIPGKDEISGLFLAFNDMMAESYDMQIAKNVQEGLVPQSFPQLKNFSVHGMLREASELGGDCLDCFMITDDKMLFLIGDITGHGVGSALMMAFSRAVTFHWSQSQHNKSPAALADQIDSMLRKNKTSRMFMGIICGILDTQSGKLELVVKGHIYPLLVKSDKSLAWVGTPAYPLGIGKFTPASSILLDLNPGDKLLCLTDGILEARSANRPLGFDGIERWALETMSEDTVEWIKILEEKFNAWSSEKQNDDISILAITHFSEKIS
jgi:hypothetical protein